MTPTRRGSLDDMSITDLRSHLKELEAERALAQDTGVASSRLYLDDLEAEIAASRDAIVVAAVTEIASFRALLSGPQVG
jgi:hypothetical protein